MERGRPIEPYEYSFIGDPFNSYFFTTLDTITYEIKFIPSTEYFSAYPDLESDAFEMTISIADNPIGNRLPSDKRTAPTIFAIFEDFFLPKTQIIVFICDSSDGRAKARHRKFGLWFYNNVIQTDLLIKLDRGITLMATGVSISY